VKQDDATALAWYRKAAEQGFAPAENALAYMHATGRGTTRDVKVAWRWFERAAKHGLALARENLNTLKGSGPGKRRAEGLGMLSLAVPEGTRTGLLTRAGANDAPFDIHDQPLF